MSNEEQEKVQAAAAENAAENPAENKAETWEALTPYICIAPNPDHL